MVSYVRENDDVLTEIYDCEVKLDLANINSHLGPTPYGNTEQLCILAMKKVINALGCWGHHWMLSDLHHGARSL